MGNTAVQKKLIIDKRLIPKYLGKLLDTTFSKYSSLNPKHNYLRTCCIIFILAVTIVHSQGSGQI